MIGGTFNNLDYHPGIESKGTVEFASLLPSKGPRKGFVKKHCFLMNKIGKYWCRFCRLAIPVAVESSWYSSTFIHVYH